MDIPDNANGYDQGWNDAASGVPVTNVCNSDYLRGYLAYEESEKDFIDPHLTDGVTIFLL